MKFCCGLFQLPIDEYVPVARAAEATGFDTIVVSDHVVHPERIETPYPYSEDGARTTAVAKNARTPRVRAAWTSGRRPHCVLARLERVPRAPLGLAVALSAFDIVLRRAATRGGGCASAN